ncbi:MAG: PDZ domain-containing protein [Acidobacteriota bacterium]
MKKILYFIFSIFLLYGLNNAITNARLLRTPDINGNLIVFVYAGDIWSVSSDGGDAKRLTSHKGTEIFPKISPDGKLIAFSAEYSGSRQVYIIPSKGGTPKQLTFYNDVGIMPPRGGYDYIAMDWTPDSKKILVRMNRTPYGRRMGKYFLVDIKGGLESPLQIPECGGGTFSPDGNKITYTPISREFRAWKRTKGGRAQDVWTYDLKKNRSERITTFPGTDQHPVWYRDKIFFVSDRSLTLNVWSYDLSSKKLEQVTKYNNFDVLWPSGENGTIVYENGGYIHKLDLSKGKSEKISVNINFDNPNTLPYFKNVSRYISRFGATITSDGKRAIFDARGDLFSVPAEKKGVTLNITNTKEIREMYPVSSPDGKWVLYISDKTGDYEFYLIDPLGKKKPVQLTKGHKVWKFPGLWSPDSKNIVFSDMDRKLQIINIESKKITFIDKSIYESIRDFSWSPDSNWIIYSKSSSNKLRAIWVYNINKNKSVKLTNDRYEDFSPIFSKDGKYIYFASDRDFDMSFQTGFSTKEFDFVYNKTARLFAIGLTNDSPSLFRDKNDLEVKVKKTPEKKKNDKTKDKKAKEKIVVKIDFKNINDRISVFPLPTSRYGGMTDLGDKVLYLKNGGLHIFNMKKKKSEVLLGSIRYGSLSADNKKLLYRSGRTWGIIDIKPKQKSGAGKLNMKDVVMKIHPVIEWKQIYNEGWRIYRDWFYVRNMHGVDWEKMRKKYAELLPYVSHRADLDYIFGELVGELNVGHTYVNWGDFEKVKRIESGLLGAELTADKKSGFYLISKIYKGENWNERTRSPLTEPGINIKEGFYLLKINDVKITTEDNPYRLLENTYGKKIKLTVNTKSSLEGSKDFWIKPLRSETDLMYFDNVESRRKLVDKLSNGRIGYIHVPNTAVEGNRELFKGLYAFNDKEAVIIDERYNGGGWSPIKMIEKLSNKAAMYWKARDLKLRPHPDFTFEGPIAMLINHYSSSGGDDFPYWFKKKRLGKLIGTRTWGGLVGYGWSPGLVDGPSFAVPMSAIVNTEGEYVVEGVGVYPDEGFEVYDRPEEIAKGNDPSIEKAVKYLLEELKKIPKKKVKSPKDPDRSKWFEKEIK